MRYTNRHFTYFTFTYFLHLLSLAPKFPSPVTLKPWVWLDANLTLNQHVLSLCKSMYFHTRALRHIRPALSDCMATTLATSLVQSRLDYENSLLHGTLAANIHKLQCAQNSLSRVILSGRHREHLSTSMRLSNLHWLPVRKRIDFKLALTTYKILSTHQPAYLRSLLFPYEPTRALRSSSQQLLSVPTVTTDCGRRAFSYCAPKIWNEVPAAIRKMLQLCKLSNTGSKPTCLVLWTIVKDDPTSHLATARASDSVIYSDIACIISLCIIIMKN